MALPEHIQKLVDKVLAGQDLTDAEELIYFTEVMGYSELEACEIFARNKARRLPMEGELQRIID